MRAATAVEIGQRNAERDADRRQIRWHPLELALLDAVDGGLADAAGLAGERLLRPALQLARVLDDAADVLGVHNLFIPITGYLCLTLFLIDGYPNTGYRGSMASRITSQVASEVSPQVELIEQAIRSVPGRRQEDLAAAMGVSQQ